MNVAPKIYYVDDNVAKLVIDSRDNLLKWWADNRYKTFDNMLVSDRGEQPHICYLRLRLQYVNSGKKIQNILERAGIAYEESPPENIVQFVLDHKDKIYPIGGKSYQITSLICDRGSFGDVFLALDLTARAQVAIKILREPADQEHLVLSRLQENEQHPNIVHYIGHEAIYGKTWIVMEYIQGEKFDWTPELK